MCLQEASKRRGSVSGVMDGDVMLRWLQPEKSLREQNIKESTVLTLRLKFWNRQIDQNDPVQLNLLCAEVGRTMHRCLLLLALGLLRLMHSLSFLLCAPLSDCCLPTKQITLLCCTFTCCIPCLYASCTQGGVKLTQYIMYCEC